MLSIFPDFCAKVWVFSQLSLWAMAKSPLMYGGDLRAIDAATLTLITNSVILDINAHSTNNHEVNAYFTSFFLSSSSR